MTKIYEFLEKEIMESNLSEEEKNKRLSKLLKARGQKINLLIVGATGSGKSSTVNALFDTKLAKIGIGTEPETKDIACYELENLTVWDTPGIGDNIEADKLYSENIVRKLSELDENGVPLIDLVMVIIDASTKDMTSVYNMINNIIIPSISQENSGRILIAVNQADVAMKGKHWDSENNCPDEVLEAFLKEKCRSVKNRLFEAVGFETEPIYYCAGYTDENGEQSKPYNLTKLLYHIVLSLPAEKRIAIAENLNGNSDVWEYDDGEEDYTGKISDTFAETVKDCISDFAERGVIYGGAALGMPGALAGGLIGGIIGAVTGVIKGFS